MKLSAVARRFEKVPVYDAYTGSFLFRCQSANFDEHSSIGATARRRVMSVAPHIAPPPRKAVSVLNDVWLVGDRNYDGFIDSEIRQGFNLKKSSGLFTVSTPAQACLASSTYTAHGYLEYYKDIQDTMTTADPTIMLRAMFASSEVLPAGTVLNQGNRFYRVRLSFETTDKFLMLECDDLGTDARSAVEFLTSQYNLLTDTDTVSVVSTYGIRLGYQQGYSREDAASALQMAGDGLLLVAKSAVTPSVSSTLRLGGVEYRVQALVSELDAWLLHIRRK